MPIITTPGQYTGISAEQYHGPDLTPSFALSSSGARTIEQECLQRFWWDSAMNPNREREEKEHFDIGKALHVLLLEEHDFDSAVKVVFFDNWRTKDAQQERLQAYEDGLIPLLAKTYLEVKAMRAAFWAHPLCQMLDFEDGLREVTLAWIDPETDVWLRCRPDFLPNHSRYMVDPKTADSANPTAFQRAIWNNGYHCQAAWYIDAIKAVRDIDLDTFYFIAMEKKPPFLISVIDLTSEAIQYGRLQNRRAIRRFADAMETGEWPGYRDKRFPGDDRAFRLGLPRYALTELEQQEKDGAL